MNTENIQNIYSLSPMQQGMLFHSIFSPVTGTYVEQTNLNLNGPLNVDAFAHAWRTVVQRNPILRTAFVWEGVDEPVQVVLNDVDFDVQFEDWRGKSEQQREQELNERLQQDRQAGFELTEAPLMRVMLFQIENDLVASPLAAGRLVATFAVG